MPITIYCTAPIQYGDSLVIIGGGKIKDVDVYMNRVYKYNPDGGGDTWQLQAQHKKSSRNSH
jgi:hypothetical protein